MNDGWNPCCPLERRTTVVRFVMPDAWTRTTCTSCTLDLLYGMHTSKRMPIVAALERLRP